MSKDHTNGVGADGIVAQLRGVSVAADSPYDAGMEEANLILHPGELVAVLLEPGRWCHPLADVLSGLAPVASGEVEVFGSAWDVRSPDDQARARGRIGRVFERRGWMSNLDVDENVTLAQRHHTTRPEGEILEEARSLARLAGMSGLPSARPALVGREDLRRAEWVRAALGSPWLVLLERPGRDLARGWLAACARVVAHVRAQGAAVVWWCGDEAEWGDPSLNASLKLRVEGNTLRTER